MKYASLWALSCASAFSFAFFIPLFITIFGEGKFIYLFRFLDIGLMLSGLFWFYLLSVFFLPLRRYRKFVLLHFFITAVIILTQKYELVLKEGRYAFLRPDLVNIAIALFWFPYYGLGAAKFILYLRWIEDKDIKRRIKYFATLSYLAIIAYFFVILMGVYEKFSLILGFLAQISTILCAFIILYALFGGERISKV
jgi:hypothetical protein